MELCSLPKELIYLIIEHLVIDIGIYKAVLIQAVNQTFKTAVQHAICTSQVIDIHHPGTPDLARQMLPSLRGHIIAAKSLFLDEGTKAYVRAVAKINRELDLLIGHGDPDSTCSRHRAVAGAVRLVDCEPLEAFDDTHNLLCGAAVVGDLPAVKALLQRRTSHDLLTVIDNGTPYFDPPLTLAAAHGHCRVVRELLLHGARLDSVSASWSEARLIRDHTDWNDWNDWSDDVTRSASMYITPPSALRAAVTGGHEDVVRLLLQKDHRFPLQNLEYIRSIIEAARTGHMNLIHTLCQTIGKCISDFVGLDREMIWAAVRGGHKEVVQMLLDDGANINAYPYPSRRYHYGTLQLAASRGDVSMVEFLVKRGADISYNGYNTIRNTPIEGAARCGQGEVVNLLIDYGADPAQAFVGAAAGGQSRLVHLLLKRLPDLPFRRWGELGLMALVAALNCCNLTIMTTLIRAGVPLEGSLFEGSLLDLAVKRGHEPWLIDYLVSVSKRETHVNPIAKQREDFIARDVCISKETWEWVGKY